VFCARGYFDPVNIPAQTLAFVPGFHRSG
jgi:hypothetical protein